MTLDEAIRHCEEVADGCSGTECKADHRQLAEWLKELKERRSSKNERKSFRVIDILTGEEADTYEIALNEDWAKDLMYCDMEGFAIEEDGSLILIDECGKYEYCPIGRFEVVWDE